MNKIYDLEYIKTNDNFREFLNELFPIIKENSKNEWKNFNKYVKEMNFEGKIAIVDIGWYGTMQKSLNKILDNVEINGFYMGLVPKEDLYDSEFFNGFIFDIKHNKDYYQKIHYVIEIFEFLFLAQHGSVKRFSGNELNVELYPYEYENTIEKNIVIEIQSGALEFIKDFKKYKNIEIILNRDFAIKKLFSVVLRPNCTDAENWGNISFVDDDVKFIAKPKRIQNYVCHPKKLIEDFKNSSWRIGFLKRLLKIKLPYYTINNVLRKIFLK